MTDIRYAPILCHSLVRSLNESGTMIVNYRRIAYRFQRLEWRCVELSVTCCSRLDCARRRLWRTGDLSPGCRRSSTSIHRSQAALSSCWRRPCRRSADDIWLVLSTRRRAATWRRPAARHTPTQSHAVSPREYSGWILLSTNLHR